MNALIGIGIFVVTLLLFEAVYSAILTYRDRGRSRIKELVRLYELSGDSDQAINILQTRVLSHSARLNKLFSYFPSIYRLDNFLQQAGMVQSVEFFILLSLALGGTGFLISVLLNFGLPLTVVMTVVPAILPTVYTRIMRKRRMAAFSRLLPDALDLIARALRAGHSFSVGLKMVSDEFPGAVGTEFARTLDEINFGLSTNAALRNLANRVHVAELKFFVVAVIIQQESGGNLAETLQSLSRIIRERFKFEGKVKALAAEGKLSAIILIAIPFLVGLALFVVNPRYIKILLIDPIGQAMLMIGIVMIIIGIYSMKNLIDIKV